jgi:hypothetical protein
MKIECPHGWKASVKLGAITYEEASVEILGGVCEAAHECRISQCRFCDVTEAGDTRFLVALRRSQTLEGYLLENVVKQ